jgi:DNA-binding IclR family transcriptional regulator
VADVVRPHLRALGDELGETVDLAVLSGGSAIFIDQVQGSRRLIALSAVGERFPLHCTANGKAILACFAEDDARELALRSAREHPNCGCADLESLMTEICKVRRSHVAFDLEEHAEGICAVGVAILDAFGRPVAISVPVPAQRFKEQKGFLVERLLAMRERLVPLISR